MSTTTLTGADNLFVGRGYDARTFNFWNRAGVPIHPLTKAVLGTPEVGDADFLIKAATSTELPDTETVTYSASDTDASPHDGVATTTTINGETVWDVRDGATYGRNIVSVATHATSVVAMTLLISGYDYTGQAMSELQTIAATGTSKTATGYKAFAYVSSISITAATSAEANTLNVGTGAKLGLPFVLASKGDMVSVTIGGVQEQINVASNAAVMEGTATTATTETGDVRGTVAFNATLDGSKEAVAWYYVAGHSSGSGVAGVAQA